MSKLGIFLVAAIVVVLDRFTKQIATARLPLDVQAVTLIPHVLFLTRTSNTGSAFGLFPGSTHILALIAGLCAVGVMIYILKAHGSLPLMLAIGLALPLGGALGNFYDRAFTGSVVDFIDLWLGRFEWPVFNVADSCICIGVALIGIYTLRHDQQTPASSTVSKTKTSKTEHSAAKAE